MVIVDWYVQWCTSGLWKLEHKIGVIAAVGGFRAMVRELECGVHVTVEISRH